MGQECWAGNGWGSGAHRVPVVSYLLQANRLADVDQVENVLLEAAAAKADRGIEELAADARVCANGVPHLHKVQQRLERLTVRHVGQHIVAQTTGMSAYPECGTLA